MLFLGQLILFRPKIFGQNDGVDFFLGFNQEPFFFFLLTPLFFQNFGAPFHLRALGNGLTGLVEGPAKCNFCMGCGC